MKENNLIKELEYTILFSFKKIDDARSFKLPTKYQNKFELNNGMDRFDNMFHRTAQIKAVIKKI